MKPNTIQRCCEVLRFLTTLRRAETFFLMLGMVEHPVTMSAKECQLLDELKAREALMAKQQAEAHKAGKERT